MPHEMTRRDALRIAAGTAAVAALPGARTLGRIMEEGVEYRTLGKTGLNVSLLGYGSTAIAGDGVDQERATRLLNEALDHGLNTVDTADCYIDAEEKIGNAISDRRDEFVLFSKCGHRGIWGGQPDWTADGITEVIDRSLSRLKTDHLDVAQLHSCHRSVLERGDAIEALQRAKEQGKTRFIGYSGDSADARYAVETDAFDTLMISVSVFDQEAIDEILPMAAERDMGVIVKRPIGNAVWRYDGPPDNGYHREYYRRMTELGYDFTSGDARDDVGPDGAAGVALRFAAMSPGVHTLVVGTGRPGRWSENNAILQEGPLSRAQWDAIRARWREVAQPNWIGQI